MTGTARGYRYRMAVGIQSAEGTPDITDANLWEYSLLDGALESIPDEAEIATTDTSDAPSGYYIRYLGAGGDFTVVSDPTSIGALWKLHLGSESAVTTAHTFTKTDAPLFGTFSQMRPDIPGGTDRWSQFTDGFVKTMEIQHAAGELLKHKVEIVAKKETFNTTAAAPTTSPAAGLAGDYRVRGTTLVSNVGLLTANGSTLLLDLDATPAVTTIHTPESITLTSSFPNFKFIQTDALTGSYWDKGSYALTITASLIFDSFASYTNSFFGNKTISASMAQSPVVISGAADFTWPIIAGTANFTQQVKVPAVRWTAQLPKAQPSGEAVRVSLTGKIIASTTDISVITKGSRTTTVYGASA